MPALCSCQYLSPKNDFKSNFVVETTAMLNYYHFIAPNIQKRPPQIDCESLIVCFLYHASVPWQSFHKAMNFKDVY